MDIEILLGEDGLAAVAKAEAAAEAQAAAEAEGVDSGSGSAGGELGAAHTEVVHEEEIQNIARSAAAAVVAATAADAATPAGGRGQNRGSAGTGTAPSGDGKTNRPRWLALEVEVHACGDIDVPYLMALIKVCFEQVDASVGT